MPKGEAKLTVSAFLWSRQEEFHTGRQQFKLGSIILIETPYKMFGFLSLEFIVHDWLNGQAR